MEWDLEAFTREKRTMLITLYGKALDNRKPKPLLGDHFADDAVRLLKLDARQLKFPEGGEISLPIRAKQLDGWTKDFIAAHPTAVVLHLGCGLDSRVFRVDPSADVLWFDVDQEPVIELRRRVYPQRPGYELLATDATSLAWLERAPKGRPVLVVAEGFTMYLTPSSGPALFRRIVEAFPSGELIFDAYSQFMVKMMTLNPALRAAGTRLTWGFGDLHALERDVPGLNLVDSIPFLAMPELVEEMGTTPYRRTMLGFMARRRWYQNLVRHVRYRFASEGGEPRANARCGKTSWESASSS